MIGGKCETCALGETTGGDMADSRVSTYHKPPFRSDRGELEYGRYGTVKVSITSIDFAVVVVIVVVVPGMPVDGEQRAVGGPRSCVDRYKRERSRGGRRRDFPSSHQSTDVLKNKKDCCSRFEARAGEI